MDAADALNYTLKQPVGVAGLISPWNLPLYLLTFKLAPAIASGNTVVAKPSEMTSVTAYMLADILNKCGMFSISFSLLFFHIVSNFWGILGGRDFMSTFEFS